MENPSEKSACFTVVLRAVSRRSCKIILPSHRIIREETSLVPTLQCLKVTLILDNRHRS